MDFNKLSNVGAFFNRAIQKTEEKFGKVEKTEFGTHMDLLIIQADKTKEWTEKLVQTMEVLVEPNLATRLQNKVFDAKTLKTTEFDSLATVMQQAGQEFQGCNQPLLGGALTMCGDAERKIADAHRSMTQTALNCLINPLKSFLDGEMKTIQRERQILEEKRLDYDSFRNKVKRTADSFLVGLEPELAIYKTAYERQLEVLKHLLLGLSSTHTHHTKCLEEFFIAQRNYHDLCLQYTTSLVQELQKM